MYTRLTLLHNKIDEQTIIYHVRSASHIASVHISCSGMKSSYSLLWLQGLLIIQRKSLFIALRCGGQSFSVAAWQDVWWGINNIFSIHFNLCHKSAKNVSTTVSFLNYNFNRSPPYPSLDLCFWLFGFTLEISFIQFTSAIRVYFRGGPRSIYEKPWPEGHTPQLINMIGWEKP